MSERLSDNRERDVVCQELSRVISSHILVRHFRDFDNLQRVSPDSVSRGHLRVQSVHRRIHSRLSVLFVRVVKPNSGLVTNPNPVVLHRRVVLLKNLVARDDLTVRFLHLSQSRESTKTSSLSPFIQGPKFHAVHLRSRFLLRRDASTNDLILVVLFIHTKKKKKKKKKNFGQSLREEKNETQCLEREAATRDERALTRTSPRREKNAFSSLKRGTPNIYRTRAERNHHRRARLRSNRRVDVVASTRRRVFSARQFSPSHFFFRVDEFPFAVTTSFSRERGLEKRVPERNDATVDRASDAQKRVVRYRLVSIPAVLALFRRVRRSRTPSPARTHARATTIVVSMSRIVAQKTGPT